MCLSDTRCGVQVEECALGWLPMDKLGQTGDQQAPQPAPALPAMPVLLYCLLTIVCTLKQFLTRALVCCVRPRADRMLLSTSIVCFYSETSPLHWKSKLRNTWGHSKAFLRLHADRVRSQAMTAIIQLWPHQQEHTHSVQKCSGHNGYNVHQSHYRAIWKLRGTPHQ